MRPEVAAVLNRVEELGLRPQPRDDHRPLAAYPSMPAGTCYLSSRILAEIFPELSVTYGRVTFYVRGQGCQVDHAWNVTPAGQVADSTLRLPDGAEDVTYWPEVTP